MCQAPIGKVTKVSEGKLVVDYKGKEMELKSKLQNVKKGDYILFSYNIAIDTVDKEEAEMILDDSDGN